LVAVQDKRTGLLHCNINYIRKKLYNAVTMGQ
jgi:hypothetical protein